MSRLEYFLVLSDSIGGHIGREYSEGLIGLFLLIIQVFIHTQGR
jgi:hypothetical protein